MDPLRLLVHASSSTRFHVYVNSHVSFGTAQNCQQTSNARGLTTYSGRYGGSISRTCLVEKKFQLRIPFFRHVSVSLVDLFSLPSSVPTPLNRRS
jgi:hypothetical protein